MLNRSFLLRRTKLSEYCEKFGKREDQPDAPSVEPKEEKTWAPSSDFPVFRTKLDFIVIETAKEFDLSIEDMMRRDNHHKPVLARQTAMYIANKNTRYSYQFIVRKFGRPDHSAVVYACKAIEKYLQTDDELKHKIQRILERVNERMAQQENKRVEKSA